MAADITDKARKSYSLLTKSLSAGISDVDTTIPFNNVTNIPTDTAVDFIIDRVDSNGTATPTLRELCKGVVSGSNLINCVRGVHGTTAQSHLSGAVVEFIVSASAHNDLIDLILADHSQSGTHEIATNYDPSNPTLETQKWVGVSSAVNELSVSNAATGGSPYLIPSGGDTNINLLGLGKGSGYFIPYMPTSPGFLINGKISASVASNNLTLALKTLAGTDPSAANPVYVNIGDSIRSVTSALSVTKNAGTNWMNLGSAEHATQDVDLFAYLGYNATDGVVIGFSRIPYALKYGDFSTTSTNDKYCAISTITNATSTDSYVVIGRFNATLGVSASYNWSIPGTAVVVQRPIYTTRNLTWSPTLTGFSANPTSSVYTYVINEHTCTANIRQGATGTSNATSKTLVAPITPITLSNYAVTVRPGFLIDSGTSSTTNDFCSIASGSTTITVGKNNSGTGFTASGACRFDIPPLTFEI